MVRVLLVDDEPFIVQGLKVMLEGQSVNCEVVGEASNGKEALEFLKQREVDLVFADIKMPVMTGLELLETIRTEKISDAYFVILSGYSDFQYAQQALRYDCMDYVLKPVKHEELERILEQVEKLNREKEEQEEKEHGDLTGGKIHRLHGFQGLGIDTKPAVGFRSLLRLPQLLSHVAGKVFVRCHIDGMAFMICSVGKLKHHAMQFFHKGGFIFSGQVGHIGDVDAGFFRQRQGQGL